MWIPAWLSRDKVDYPTRCYVSGLAFIALIASGSTHSDSVDDSQTKGSPLQTVPHGQDGISSLTRLGYKDGDVVPEDGSLSVEEVRGYK